MTLTPSHTPSTEFITKRHLVDVVVAYENFHSGKRAQYACQQIVSLAHGDGTMSLDLWKFDMLKLHSMQAVALEAAASAILLVLAPQDGMELPPGMMNWLRLIFQQPTHPKALLALLEPAPEDPALTSPVQEQLQEFAEKIQLWCLRTAAADRPWFEPGYETAELEHVARDIRSMQSVSVCPSQEMAVPLTTDGRLHPSLAVFA